jgi:hypothetical protein
LRGLHDFLDLSYRQFFFADRSQNAQALRVG